MTGAASIRAELLSGLARLDPGGATFSLGPAEPDARRWQATFPIADAPRWREFYLDLARRSKKPEVVRHYELWAAAILEVISAADSLAASRAIPAGGTRQAATP